MKQEDKAMNTFSQEYGKETSSLNAVLLENISSSYCSYILYGDNHWITYFWATVAELQGFFSSVQVTKVILESSSNPDNFNDKWSLS